MKTLEPSNLPRWPQVVPVSWFVTLTAGGTGLALAQELVGSSLPIQFATRAALLACVLLALPAVKRPQQMSRLTLPIAVFLLALLCTLTATLVRRDDWSAVASSYAFMYSLAAPTFLFLLAPMVVRRSRLFLFLAIGAISFGLIQILSQNLLLPPGFRENFGVVWDEFVNGRVRATSFFASPPRFAELLVFCLAYLQYPMLAQRRGFWKFAGPYIVVQFVLLNTFSRSGYVLFGAMTLMQLILIATSRNPEARMVLRSRVYFLALIATLVTLPLLSGTIRLDGSVTDSTSLLARQSHWSALIEAIRSGGVLDLLFGTGRSAQFSAFSEDYFVVDNLLLAVYFHGGLLALAGFAYLFVSIARTILKDRHLRAASRWIPALAFYVALPVEGMFVDNHNTVLLVQFALIGMLVHDWTSRGVSPGEATNDRSIGALSSQNATYTKSP